MGIALYLSYNIDGNSYKEFLPVNSKSIQVINSHRTQYDEEIYSYISKKSNYIVGI